MEGPGADSEAKRVLASDLDTVMVDSLKALDLIRPIREADIAMMRYGRGYRSTGISARPALREELT